MTTTAAPYRPLSIAHVASLVAAPLVALIARVLMTPWLQDSNDQPASAEYLAQISESPVRNDLGAIFTLLSALLLVAAALVLAAIVRRRMPRLSLIGAAMTVFGALGLGAVSTEAMVAGQMARLQDRDAMVGLWDRMYAAPQMQIFSLAVDVGALGFVLLAVGLYRSGVVGRGAGILAGIGGAGIMVTAPGPAPAFIITAAAIAVVGFSWVAAAARRPSTERAGRAPAAATQ